ncbi:MAG: hypothetical protein E7678_08225 [Ruminococcaceae bacterium]|nr:hypothetical protein [Oscillospiraceae bacterium]
MSEKFKDFLRVEHLTYEEYRKKILDYTLGYGLEYMDTLDLIMRDKYWFDPIAEKEELMRF